MFLFCQLSETKEWNAKKLLRAKVLSQRRVHAAANNAAIEQIQLRIEEECPEVSWEKVTFLLVI